MQVKLTLLSASSFSHVTPNLDTKHVLIAWGPKLCSQNYRLNGHPGAEVCHELGVMSLVSHWLFSIIMEAS